MSSDAVFGVIATLVAVGIGYALAHFHVFSFFGKIFVVGPL